MRVVTANLLHGLDLASGRVDLIAAVAALEPLAADVVAVQEVDRGLGRSGGTDQVSLLAEHLGMVAAFAPAAAGDPEVGWRVPADDDGGPAYGIGLLARHPLAAVRRLRLPGGGGGRPPARRRERKRVGAPRRPPLPGWDREPRVALSATVRLAPARAHCPPTEIRVTTAHLSYLPWRGVAGLRRVLRVAGAGGGPAVVCGDLNLPAMLVRALAVGWRAAGGQPTYPAWRPVVQPDQLLVSGDVAVERTSVVTGPSDHRLLVVDLHAGG